MPKMDYYYEFRRMNKTEKERAKERLEQKRQQFVNDYTIETIRNLEIDNYIVGKGDRSTFCYRLESGTRELGLINGATSTKFGVYFGKNGKKASKRYRHTKKFGNSLDEAFSTVKTELEKLIIAGKNDDFKTIEKSKFCPLVKGKILYLYYPDKYIPVYSEDYLASFIDFLGIRCQKRDFSSMQKSLLQWKNKQKETKNLCNFDFCIYLYSLHDPSREDPDKENENQTNRVSSLLPDDDESDDEDPGPRPKPKAITIHGNPCFPRDVNQSRKAIKRANFQCELNPEEHKSFIKKFGKGKERYVEAHHLVPMSKCGDSRFRFSLDDPRNIVALCSECHNQIHYGLDEDVREMLKKLYEMRRNQLKKIGINITLDELLDFYGIKPERKKKK